MSLAGSLLFGIGLLARQVWDQKNEAAQSDSRPDGNAAGTRASTNSLHSPSREGHLPPVSGTDFYWLTDSDGCLGGLPCPMELGAVDPHPVHDDSKAARQSDDSFLLAAPFGHVHCPRFQPGPFLDAG